MDQQVEPSPPTVNEIVLSRGTAGLGFNIRGGADNPHIPGDTGIFVTKVRGNGAAFSDGRLKEGDRILSINGKSLVDVKHEEAVQCFTRAKDIVELQVEHGAQAEILRKRQLEKETNIIEEDEPKQSSNIGKYIVIAMCVGLAVGGALIYRKISKGLVSYR